MHQNYTITTTATAQMPLLLFHQDLFPLNLIKHSDRGKRGKEKLLYGCKENGKTGKYIIWFSTSLWEEQRHFYFLQEYAEGGRNKMLGKHVPFFLFAGVGGAVVLGLGNAWLLLLLLMMMIVIFCDCSGNNSRLVCVCSIAAACWVDSIFSPEKEDAAVTDQSYFFLWCNLDLIACEMYALLKTLLQNERAYSSTNAFIDCEPRKLHGARLYEAAQRYDRNQWIFLLL